MAVQPLHLLPHVKAVNVRPCLIHCLQSQATPNTEYWKPRLQFCLCNTWKRTTIRRRILWVAKKQQHKTASPRPRFETPTLLQLLLCCVLLLLSWSVSMSFGITAANTEVHTILPVLCLHFKHFSNSIRHTALPFYEELPLSGQKETRVKDWECESSANGYSWRTQEAETLPRHLW